MDTNGPILWRIVRRVCRWSFFKFIYIWFNEVSILDARIARCCDAMDKRYNYSNDGSIRRFLCDIGNIFIEYWNIFV